MLGIDMRAGADFPAISSGCRTHDEVYEATCDYGVGKAAYPFLSSVCLTFLAGAYIALGAFLAIRAAGGLDFDTWGSMGKLVFGMVFPVGLMLVVLCGADLFTGNCMTLTASCCSKRITVWQCVRGWLRSWSGNFIGALFVAWFLAYESRLIFDVVRVGGEVTMPWASYAVNLANAKCDLDFMEAFWRGVGCNWMVCLAVYAATAARDVTGKIVALWLPTMAFVALGMEHCIANMFFIPLGIFAGRDAVYMDSASPSLTADWLSFLVDNLIPVTLGNVVGGAILVAGFYAVIYGRRCAKG